MSTEIDAQVAEKVMGWNTVGGEHPLRLEREKGGYIYDGLPFCFPKVPPGSVIADRWAPSTDIAAAWSIVELLLGNCRGHFAGGISRGWEREGGPLRWCCTFPGHDTAWADTAPMAICLAALDAHT